LRLRRRTGNSANSFGQFPVLPTPVAQGTGSFAKDVPRRPGQHAHGGTAFDTSLDRLVPFWSNDHGCAKLVSIRSSLHVHPSSIRPAGCRSNARNTPRESDPGARLLCDHDVCLAFLPLRPSLRSNCGSHHRKAPPLWLNDCLRVWQSQARHGRGQTALFSSARACQGDRARPATAPSLRLLFSCRSPSSFSSLSNRSLAGDVVLFLNASASICSCMIWRVSGVQLFGLLSTSIRRRLGRLSSIKSMALRAEAVR